jgi:Cd2+/Zn2+-exporting ATPase
LSKEYIIPVPWNRIGISFVAFLALVSLHFYPFGSTFKIIIYLSGALIGSWYFAQDAVRQIINNRRLNTDVIMLLAVIGSGVLLEFGASLTLIFLYSITETLESYTVRRTKTSIKSLLTLVPETAIVVKDGVETTVARDDLQIDNHIKLVIGDIVPTDGIIVSGNASFNEATITGEHLPVFKVANDNVIAGTTCMDGSIIFSATRTSDNNTISRIIELVEIAQSKKLRKQLLIERFTSVNGR